MACRLSPATDFPTHQSKVERGQYKSENRGDACLAVLQKRWYARNFFAIKRMPDTKNYHAWNVEVSPTRPPGETQRPVASPVGTPPNRPMASDLPADVLGLKS